MSKRPKAPDLTQRIYIKKTANSEVQVKFNGTPEHLVDSLFVAMVIEQSFAEFALKASSKYLEEKGLALEDAIQKLESDNTKNLN